MTYISLILLFLGVFWNFQKDESVANYRKDLIQYVLSEILAQYLEYCRSHEHLPPPYHVRWFKWKKYILIVIRRRICFDVFPLVQT